MMVLMFYDKTIQFVFVIFMVLIFYDKIIKYFLSDRISFQEIFCALFASRDEY